MTEPEKRCEACSKKIGSEVELGATIPGMKPWPALYICVNCFRDWRKEE